MSCERTRFVPLLAELAMKKNFILVNIKSFCIIRFDDLIINFIQLENSVEQGRLCRQCSSELELRIFLLEVLRALLEMIRK